MMDFRCALRITNVNENVTCSSRDKKISAFEIEMLMCLLVCLARRFQRAVNSSRVSVDHSSFCFIELFEMCGFIWPPFVRPFLAQMGS